MIIKIVLQLKYWLILIFGLLLVMCGNPNESKSVELKPYTAPNTGNDKANELVDGERYSDSMANKIIEQQLAKGQNSIDTFETLHNIECPDLFDFGEYKFTMDSVFKYQSKKELGSQKFRQLLEVSDCFFRCYSTNKFDAYIFYSDIVESHSSQSFSIIAIDKKYNLFEKLILTKEYGNESGDYVISSVLKKDLAIERAINHNVRYIEGIREVDSIYRVREEYQLTQDGKFERISKSLEPSKEVNQIFEQLE